MLINDDIRLREILMKMINVSQQEITIYNEKFINLIGINVDKLYEDELNEYNNLKSKYEAVEGKINEYNTMLDKLPLINKKMSENDYIERIKELESEYSKKYNNLKILESQMKIYRDKILDYDNKILMQESKEQNRKNKKQETNKDRKEKLMYDLSKQKILKELVENKIDLIKQQLSFQKERYNYYNSNKEIIENGDMTCKYCNTKLVHKKAIKKLPYITLKLNSVINLINRHNNNIQKEQEKLNKIKEKMEEIRIKINNIKSEESQSEFLYIKKSVKVLDLEASKFTLESKLESCREEFNQLSRIAGQDFKYFRNKLNNYKISLYNLMQIKETKKIIQNDIEKNQELIESIKLLEEKLKIHTEYIETRYKLIERKLNNLFEGKIKVKLYKLKNYTFYPKCILYLNNIEQSVLTIPEQNALENLIKEKIKLMGEI